MVLVEDLFLEVEDTKGAETSSVKIRYVEIVGDSQGPALFVLAGLHGDELTGVEVIKQLKNYFSKNITSGKVTLVPVANPIAFAARQRQTIHDNKDLNRCFPGDPEGTITDKIAYEITEKIVKKSEYGIDLHTGPNGRILLPHTRMVLDETKKVKELSKLFGTMISWIREPVEGALAIESKAFKVPTIAVEIGEGNKLDNFFVKSGIFGVTNIAKYLGLLDGRACVLKDQYIMNERNNIIANSTGIFYPKTDIGKIVNKGNILAEIYDTQNNVTEKILADRAGLVLAMQTSSVAVAGTTIISTLSLGACGINTVSLVRKKCMIYHTRNPKDLLLNMWA